MLQRPNTALEPTPTARSVFDRHRKLGSQSFISGLLARRRGSAFFARPLAYAHKHITTARLLAHFPVFLCRPVAACIFHHLAHGLAFIF